LVGDKRRVRGVRTRGRAEGNEAQIDADLVVDATGRGSQTPKWLEALGCARPAESVVKVDVCYATRFFKRPPEGTVPWKVLFVVGESPASRRLGIVAPVEGDRWIALLVGLLGDHPPADDSRKAQRAISATANGAWMMATGEDLRHPEVAGERPFGSSLVNCYMARFMRATQRDPELTALLYRVVHMLAEPTALMHPAVALRVLRFGGAE
jgi:hypothetical protein